MAYPFNIRKKIFRNQPFSITVAVKQEAEAYECLDLSQYQIKAVIVRLVDSGECYYYNEPEQLGPVVCSQDSVSYDDTNTFATATFSSVKTAALVLGDDNYKWFYGYAPSGSGSATTVLCSGPAEVVDSPLF